MRAKRLVAVRGLAAGLLGLILAGSGSVAAPRPGAADEIGLAVGERAPQFTLKDQDGRERRLDDFLGKKKVALVFFRSADWCPYCRKQLAQLQADGRAFEDAGIQLVGISYDPPAALKKYAEQARIAFPLLSDPGSATIDAYHVRNTAAKGKAEGVPRPATFVLDPKGVIRAKLVLEDYRQRHTTAALVDAARSVP